MILTLGVYHKKTEKAQLAKLSPVIRAQTTRRILGVKEGVDGVVEVVGFVGRGCKLFIFRRKAADRACELSRRTNMFKTAKTFELEWPGREGEAFGRILTEVDRINVVGHWSAGVGK